MVRVMIISGMWRIIHLTCTFLVDPACDAAVASLAQMLLEQGEPEEALRYYETAIDLARTEAELQHAISYVEATKAQVRYGITKKIILLVLE